MSREKKRRASRKGGVRMRESRKREGGRPHWKYIGAKSGLHSIGVIWGIYMEYITPLSRDPNQTRLPTLWPLRAQGLGTGILHGYHRMFIALRDPHSGRSPRKSSRANKRV